MRKKLLAIIATTVALLALVLFTAPMIALGEESNSMLIPTTEEERPDDDLIMPLIEGLQKIGNDSLWAGMNLELGGHKFDNDLLAAGLNLTVADCKAGGSIRLAGRNVRITNSTAEQSITAAGQEVSVENTNANAVALTGATARYSGTCNELSISAGNVVIDGTVEGDVTVNANNVAIGSHANIKGTLHVAAAKEPVLESGAKVVHVDFKKSESSSSTTDTVNGMAGVGLALFIVGIFISTIGTLVVAILAEWLFKRHTQAAAQLIRTRTAATIGTGIIGSTVAPICIVLAFVLVVTIPVAVVLILTLVSIALASCGFMGASLSKVVFPRMGRFKCALAGGAIVGVASAIPILGILVSIVAFVYLFGYVLQSIYLGMRQPLPPTDSAM